MEGVLYEKSPWFIRSCLISSIGGIYSDVFIKVLEKRVTEKRVGILGGVLIKTAIRNRKKIEKE